MDPRKFSPLKVYCYTVFVATLTVLPHYVKILATEGESFFLWLFPFVEMKEEHIFRNYSSGEPSVRLYLKNVAKQVDEEVECMLVL